MLVIKAGGGRGIHYESVCDELAALHRDGQAVVVVHGGSHLTNELAEALGHPPQFVTSPGGFTSRFTDRRTMEIFMMAYCGHTNKTIVEGLQRRGVNAIGLSGIDARIWTGRQKDAIRVVDEGGRAGDDRRRERLMRGNLTGTVDEVNHEFLKQLVRAEMMPVVCPPAMTREGVAINVDGDRAAAITAARLGARELLILSNVPGVMRDVENPDSLIPRISRAELESVSNQYAEGRMKIKLLAAAKAIDGGVQRVVIADARPEHCVSRALDGNGTVIEAERAHDNEAKDGWQAHD